MMRLPRITTRRIMILILGTSLFLGLVVPALRLGFVGSTGYHRHPDGSYHRAEFFARYWRSVLGRPWPGSYVCTQGRGGPFVDVDFPAPHSVPKTIAYLILFLGIVGGIFALVLRVARTFARAVVRRRTSRST